MVFTLRVRYKYIVTRFWVNDGIFHIVRYSGVASGWNIIINIICRVPNAFVATYLFRSLLFGPQVM